MSPRLLAYFSLTLTAIIWTFGSVLIKYTLNYISPLTFLFWRFLIVSLVFLPFVWKKSREASLTLKDLFLLAGLGVLATTLTLGLLFWGTALTSAVEAIIINAFAPILILLGGALFLREKITRLEKIGAGLAFSGSLFEVVRPILKNDSQALNLKGNLLVLASVFVWAVYSLLARHYQSSDKKYDSILVTGTSFLSGFITITPFFVVEKWLLNVKEFQAGLPLTPWWWVDNRGWFGIIFMALLGSCIAYFTYNLGLALIEASEAGIFTYLQSVFAVPLAVIWLKEPLDWWLILGSLLILAGIIITEYKGRERRRLKPPTN